MRSHIAQTVFRLQHWSRFLSVSGGPFRSSDLVLLDPVLGIWPFVNWTGLVTLVTIGKGDRFRSGRPGRPSLGGVL